MKATDAKVIVLKNGPYEVRGEVPLSRQIIVTDEKGGSVGWKEGEHIPAPDGAHLCRCGHSSKKPFCDGTHKKIRFDGTETASRAAYLEQAEEIDGPAVVLTDAEPLCAFARFCDEKGRIWNVARRPLQRVSASCAWPNAARTFGSSFRQADVTFSRSLESSCLWGS